MKKIVSKIKGYFQGSTVDEIESEFKASVDDYLAWCREDGVEPEKL